MKEIALTNGGITTVDDDDYLRIQGISWHVTNRGYVRSARSKATNHKQILLHRFLTDAPVGLEVDHKDRDKLNNQKSNLRLCTTHENQGNRKMSKVNTSGFYGACFDKSRGKWYSQIRNQYKRIRTGYFDTREEAARAYDKMATEIFGEFATLNFPLPAIESEG